MIASLIAALREAGLDPTAEEVADVVWLACHARLGRAHVDPEAAAALTSAPTSETDAQPSPSAPEPQVPHEREEPSSPLPTPSLLPSPGGGLYTWPSRGGHPAGGPGGIPFRSPGARALPGALELARALRPLMRRVGSRTKRVLDEEATINRIAEERIWSFVSRPAPTRWLEAALVIDEGASMRVWRETVREFTRLLELQGAFRDVRTWRLDTDSGVGEIQLRVGDSGLLRSPTELIDPSGRRVIIVITDCVSPAWEGGHLARMLAEWGRHHPVAILQMLPQKLWAQTALYAARQVRVRPSRAGQPNAQLLKEAGRPSRRAPEGVPVPVFTLEPTPTATWARLVAGLGGARAPAFLLASAGRPLLPRQQMADAEPSEPSADELLKAFRARVSPTAFELARLMAAAPLTLPVMRLVQRVLLPESRQVHLAEVFLGGVLRRVGTGAEDVDEAHYDFLPGLRELLLDSTPVPDSVAVIKVVSRYLEERVGQSLDFAAILAAPDAAGGLAVDESNRAFARIGAEVLRRLGGRYSAVADRLTGVWDTDPAPGPEPKSQPEPGSPEKDDNIAKLIEEAFRSKATALDLSSRGLTEVPERLLRLRSLRRLNLSRNDLTELPLDIGLLTRLRLLDVSHNLLTSVPPTLGNLRQLEELHLTHNRLASVPSSLSHLSSLRHLCLNHNRLKRLPAKLGDLERLEQLELSSNMLSSLPESLGGLVGLGELRLDKNRLSSLPESLLELRLLEKLYLQDNEALGIPAEVLGADPDTVFLGVGSPASPQRILGYYFNRKGDGRALYEAKVVLVGRGGSGKTSIIHRLLGGDFGPNQPRTHGLQVSEWQISSGKGEPVRLHFWDLGGQEVYHSVNQLFFTKHSLYLLVLTGRVGAESADADYWLKLIGSRADEPPVIVVLNKSEEHPFDLNRRALQQKYPFIREFVRTDCATGLGIEQLRVTIEREVGRMEHVGVPLPQSWFSVKNRLAAMKHDYLIQSVFRDLCADCGVADESEQNLLGGYLHDLGHLLWFREDPALQNVCVLNPAWLTQAINLIIECAGRNRQRGLVQMGDLKEVLKPARYPKHTYQFVLNLMVRFDLCFNLPADPEAYLIPQMLDSSPPVEISEFNPEESLNFQYQYEPMPPGLLPRFIVRTSLYSEGLPRWHTGVILKFEDCRALVAADVQDRRVSINVKGRVQDRPRLLALIRQQFEQIHRDFSGFRVQELVPLPGRPETTVPYEELLAQERAGVASFAVVARDSVIQVDVRALLDGLVPEDERRGVDNQSVSTDEVEKDARTHIYLSYSHNDSQLIEEFKKHLEPMRRTLPIAIWDDAFIMSGESWTERSLEAIRLADIIIMFVSPDYLASDFIRGVEMPETLKRREAGEALVIPVILRDCVWERTPLAKLQMLPEGGRPITLWPNRAAAFHNVAEGIREVLEKSFPVRPFTWPPQPGSRTWQQLPLSKLKITLLGDSGAGKTVFAASMYAKLREGSHGIAIRANSSEVDLELDQAVASLYLNDRWPLATEGEEKPYEFELLLRGKPIAYIDLVIYGQEEIFLRQEMKGAEDPLINRLRESNSIFWLIDMSQINQNAVGTLSARLTTKVGRILQLLRQAVAGNHNIQSILYVGAKSDIVLSNGGEPDWNLARDLLVKHIGPARLGDIPYSAAIPISSIGRTTEGGLSIVGADPYNVEWPLLLALAFMLEDNVKGLGEPVDKSQNEAERAGPNTIVRFLKDILALGSLKEEQQARQEFSSDSQQLIQVRKIIKGITGRCPESIKIFK